MKKIPLLRGSKIVAETAVDDEDYEVLSAFIWRLSSNGYATRSDSSSGCEKRLLMHRVVLGTPEGQVDHADRDRLNNQKSNLRVVSNSLNQHNAGAKSTSKTGIRGVTFDEERNRWRARVMIEGKHIHLGRFSSCAEAAGVIRKWKESILGGERFSTS